MAYFRKRVYASSYARPFKRRRLMKSSTSKVRQFNRRTRRGPSTRGPLRSQVKSLQRVVRNLAPEVKYKDTSLALSNVSTAGGIVHITSIDQGDSVLTRTGNTINVTDIACRAVIVNAADNANSDNCRFLVVVDRQQVADTLPAPGDVISDGFFTANPVINLPNVANLERFRILHSSWLYELRRVEPDLVADTFGPPTQSSYYEFNWKGNLKVSYNGTASSDIEKNGIYFIVLTDNANTVDIAGVARVGYTDM